MAEGGVVRHGESPSANTSVSSLDSHPLECPICLEQLRQPKSLPCLHCFCQECLCTFITKDLSGNTSPTFTCPVCRRVTQPVDPSENKENWAKQFPTNSLIQELIQLQKKTHSPLYCKPCGKKGNLESPAQVWCKSCNSLFCEVCKVNFHDVIHDDCDVIFITGTDVTIPQQTPAVVRCNKHKEKIDYYCEDHKILGCNKCIIIDHRRCDIVTTTEEYCEKLKTSSQQESLVGTLQESVGTIETLVHDFSEQFQTLVKQQDAGLKTITELRRKIDQYLDEIQKKITNDLITAVQQEKDNLEAASQKCEQLKTSMLNTLESSKSAAEKNDNMEMILLYKRGQMEVEACKDLLTELRKTYTSVSVKHVIDPGQETVGRDTCLNLGKIVVEKEPRYLPGGTEYFTPPLSERRVKEIGKFCIKRPSDYKDCCANGVIYLSDNHIVVGDFHNQKLKLYTDKGQYRDELKVKGYPMDMCMVDNNTVAVAVSSPGSIHVVNVQSSKLSLLYNINSPNGDDCHGITHTDGKFIVSTGTQVYRMTQDGKSELLQTLNNTCYSLTNDPKHGHIYASQWTSTTGDTAVYRLSGKTKTDIMKVGVVNCAFGVDIDREGNVYVCGNYSHNVVQMFGDGTNVRELLTSSDGVSNPRVIAVCGDIFVVTNLGNQQNYVYVYSLY